MKNNLDELINLPTKAEERSVIQISLRTQDANIVTGTIRNPRQNSQLIHDPLCFQNPPICSIYRKIPQSVRFLRPNPSKSERSLNYKMTIITIEVAVLTG